MVDRSSLGLPAFHPLSVRLEASLASASGALDLVRGLISAHRAGKGLTRLELQAGSIDGYGIRTWSVLVGGAGPGADEDVMFGGFPRAPVSCPEGSEQLLLVWLRSVAYRGVVRVPV